MLELSHLLTISAILILMGVCACRISTRLNVPILLLFLGIGILAGSDGIGKIYFDNPEDANIIGSIALAFILFSGGYDTQWRSVKSVLTYGSILSSLGVLLTAVLVGFFAYYLLECPLEWALLLGALISSTDAAAVFAVLRSRSVSLHGKLRPLLEYESGSNDPMAAFLTIFMVGLIGNAETSYWMILPMFLMKMSAGIAFGYICARGAVWLFNKIDLEYDGLYYVLGIGVVLLSFGGCEWLGGNGFMSVYVCGMVLGNSKFIYQHGLGHFHSGISWLMQVILFVVLGLLIFPSRLPQIAGEGFLIALFLMFIARPVAVFLCMLGSSFSYKERVFVSWVGLRGGAPIVLATFPLMAGVEDAWILFEIVFVIVLISVLVQGRTIMMVARFLHLDKPLKKHARVPLSLENTGNISSQLHEFEVRHGMALVGTKLADAGLPRGGLVLLIRRNNAFVVPHGDTLIEPGDILMILAEPDAMSETILFFGGDTESYDA